MSLQYSTNGPEFDFPRFDGLPPVRYVISSSPRCGSNMLQRGLWRTGLAGAPEEYLTEPYVRDFVQRWGNIRRNDGECELNVYLSELMRHRTSPNGVFGVKTHAVHLDKPLLRGIDLDALLCRPRYLWIRRSDRIYQAVSYALAIQTDVWIEDGEWLPNKAPATRNPVYNFDAILKCLRQIDAEESQWETFFRARKICPHVIVYETLMEDYERSVRGCLEYLGIDNGQLPIDGPGIRRQATAVNDDWALKFRAEHTTLPAH